ncbi:MAG: hypothetical protein C0514_02615 [Candidatus Puniceispirillum sp.]|nr:hypothetical protein [Candidatus Puniceispirillum sp.]
MAIMTNGALLASAVADDDQPPSSSTLPISQVLAPEKALFVEKLRACDVAPLLSHNATHLTAIGARLNFFEDYSGLLDYISKNKSLRSVTFPGRSNFHEKKWLALHNHISENTAIKTVYFEHVTLNVHINNPNPRVKKVLSRELLDALSKEYEEGGTRKSAAPLAPPAAPVTASERASKRTRALQSVSPAQSLNIGMAPLRSEHFTFSGERQMIVSPHFPVVHEHPAQASSTRLVARTAVTRVWDGSEDESFLDVHTAQSSSSMEPTALAVSTVDTAICDDDDAAEKLLVLKHTGRTDFKKPRH